MKVTEQFKASIKCYLEACAKEDAQFALTYAKQGKSIDECINYILHQVKESGCCGFTDAEIYGMAVHYYDEDSIKGIEPLECDRIVVNHVVELSDEDKAEAKRKAVEEYQREMINNERKKAQEARRRHEEAVKAKNEAWGVETQQKSLFD